MVGKKHFRTSLFLVIIVLFGYFLVSAFTEKSESASPYSMKLGCDALVANTRILKAQKSFQVSNINSYSHTLYINDTSYPVGPKDWIRIIIDKPGTYKAYCDGNVAKQVPITVLP